MSRIEALELLPLSIRRASFAEAASSKYRIFREDGGFVDIEAGTAAEAMSRSGMADAARIVCLAYGDGDVTERRLELDAGAAIETDVSDIAKRKSTFVVDLPPDETPEEFVEMSVESLVAVVSAPADPISREASPKASRPRRHERHHVLTPGDVERLLAGDPSFTLP